jgi:hypothetical protein
MDITISIILNINNRGSFYIIPGIRVYRHKLQLGMVTDSALDEFRSSTLWLMKNNSLAETPNQYLDSR